MDSLVKKRSIVLSGHKTSVSLEEQFWQALRAIAHERQTTLGQLVEDIDRNRKQSNLSSAIRLFVLSHFVTRLRDLGERGPLAALVIEEPQRAVG